MWYKKVMGFIRTSLSSNNIILYSEKIPEEIYSEMQLVFNRKIMDLSVNLTGKIDYAYNFELTKKFEHIGYISIGGFAGMNAGINGVIKPNKNCSEINIFVKPNSAYPLLFVGGLLSALVIILLVIFGIRFNNTLFVISLSFVLMLISLICSYFSKRSLLEKFITTFDLKELPEN